MENNLDLSIILPIKSALAKDFKDFFDKAIKSVQDQTVKPKDLIIVHTKEDALTNLLKEYDFGELNVKLVAFDGEANFSDQINLGMKESDSKWVSFFEFDDQFSQIWLSNVKKYIDGHPNVNGFLPIVLDVDSKGMFAGFTNEVTFVTANNPNEMGVLTSELLDRHQNFQTSGMVIERELVIKYGGFKPSITLTFSYEFLLRMVYNSMMIITIPKLGYKHLNMREGSIFWNYKYGQTPLTPEEAKFWMELPGKEYFFTEDRKIKFEPNEQ